LVRVLRQVPVAVAVAATLTRYHTGKKQEEVVGGNKQGLEEPIKTKHKHIYIYINEWEMNELIKPSSNNNQITTK
jgi:hypothetical protein